MIVISDFIGEIGHLRFQRWLLAVDEALADLAELACVVERAVLQDSLARFEHQIQSIESAVALLEGVDHAQALQIVLETTMLAHAIVQGILAGMTERRMAEIVRQRNRLDQVFVQIEAAGDRARDLCNFDAVGQARPEQVALMIDEHLCLVFQSAKCGAMDDAVAVALEFGARRRGWFGEQPARRIGGLDSVRRQGYVANHRCLGRIGKCRRRHVHLEPACTRRQCRPRRAWRHSSAMPSSPSGSRQVLRREHSG